MEKRKTLLNKIARIISFYAATIQSNVESGRTDILIDAEKICCSLLNITFGFELKLLNQSKRNLPAIDMADEQRRVAVQVTSSNTRAKVQNTLKSFLEHGLNDQYDTLLVFILVAAPQFRQRVDFSVPDGMELKVMTFLDLIRELEYIEEERLEEVARYLDETIGTDTASSSADAVSTMVSSDVIKGLTEDARQVFNFAGFLPEAGLERNVFEYGLEPLQRKALPDLLEQGVLYQKDMIIHLHPNVRNQAQAQAVKDHAQFLDRLWDYEKSWHWDRVSLSREIALQRSLAQVYALAAELFSERAVVYALRSAELYRNTQQYKQALRQEQKALQILESDEEDHWATARAHHFSGECYTALQEYASALKEWGKTLSLCQGVLHVSGLDLAEAYHNVGRALTALGQYEDAEQELLNALKLLEDFRQGCPEFTPQPWMKEIYDSLATVYSKLNQNRLAALCSQNVLLPPAKQATLWILLSPKRREHLLDLPLRTAMAEGSFVGREMEMAQITERFKSDHIVILSGMGGMGKTELAVRFGKVYADSGAGRVWFVEFRGDFFRTVVEGIAQGIIELAGQHLDEHDKFREAMNVLVHCDREDLLIIDNVDFEKSSLAAFRWELSRLPMRILVTTRCDVVGGINVGSLRRVELYHIFRLYAGDIREVDMDALIDAVGSHTMTVDLIARSMRPGRRAPTAETILTSLSKRVLNSASFMHITSSYHGDPKQAQIQEHLRTVFRIAELSNDEQTLLRCATLLPTHGMSDELFMLPFREEMQDVLDNLIQKGWLLWENDLLRIHPIICIVCQEELKPTEETCGGFLKGVWNWYDQKKYDRDIFPQLAELLTNAAEILDDQDGWYIHSAGHLWNELGEYQLALQCNLRAVERLEQCQPGSKNLATAYDNVGSTYGDLGNHAKALEYKLKSLAIREKVLTPEHPDLAASYNNVGYTYGTLGDHTKALEYKLKALAIRKRILSPDHPDLAASYNNVGYTYDDLGDYAKALKHKEKALAIREQILPPDHPDLAVTYNNVGYSYGALGDHAMALEYKLKDLAICEKVLPLEHPYLATAYNNVGSTYGDLGDPAKALEYQQKALAIREKVLPPEHPDLAQSYNNLGYTYGDLGNHARALEYHSKSLAIREKALPPEHPSIALSYHNIAWVYHDMGDYQCALEYMRRAVDIAEQSLPEGHPERVKYRTDLENLERDIRQ